MARLDDLFYVKNGIASGNVRLLETQTSSSIPYIRPSKSQQRTIAGWIERSSVPAEHRHQKHSIFVSTNGEGSHTYAYVSNFEFAANSDVSILIPERVMTLAEKIFYAKAITLNRGKFSYGRKPKGDRLKQIELPNAAPDWTKCSVVETVKFGASACKQETPRLNEKQWLPFRYDQIFSIERGESYYAKNLHQGKFPYVSASAKNNGVSGYYSINNQDGNAITLSYDGSIGEAFYQPDRFLASEKVAVLRIHHVWRKSLNSYLAMFLITLIGREKYRFTYGLKWAVESRMPKSINKLPVTNDGSPDWAFMESYIKTLPFSSAIN